jgi:hypothetical protein
MHTQSNTTCRLNLPSGFPDSHYLLPSDAEPTGSVSESKRGTPYLSLLAAMMLSRWNPIHLLPISPLLSARGDRWQRIHLGGPSGWFIALSADSLASDDCQRRSLLGVACVRGRGLLRLLSPLYALRVLMDDAVGSIY